MPIYEYRCSSCGFQKEYLRKVSDPALSVCPECNKNTFSKMLSAPGFQLKGSGWYATDFKNSGSSAAAKPAAKADSAAKSGGKESTAAKSGDASPGKSDGKSDSKTDGKSESKSEAAA